MSLVNGSTANPPFLHLGERMEQLSEWILEKLDVFQADVQKRFYRKMVREPKYLGTEPEMKKMSTVKAHKAIAPLKEKAQKSRLCGRAWDVPEIFIRIANYSRSLCTCESAAA